MCLSVAKDLHLNKVVVESDAATVVDCISGKATMAAIDPIIQDCCSILNLFEDIKVTAISRNQNSVGHVLVQLFNWPVMTMFLFSSNESICISKCNMILPLYFPSWFAAMIFYIVRNCSR